MEIAQNYQDWRKTIFTIPFDRDDPTPDVSQIESVIMDLGRVDSKTSTPQVMTLKVFTPNIASYFLTSGDSLLNVGRQPKVALAAAEILRLARELQPHTQRTRDYSLPGPGVVQFFFVPHNGVSALMSPVDEVQRPGHLFQPLFDRFAVIRQVAESIVEERRSLQAYTSTIQTLYVMAFVPETLDPDSLNGLVHEAVEALKKKNLAFKQRFDGKPSDVPVATSQVQFNPAVHTPKNMQTLLSEWLMQQYNITFQPKEDDRYFFHGMRNSRGRQTIFLFYYDFES